MTHEELLKKREQVLLKLMEDPMYQPMRLREIALFLDVPKSKRRDLEETLDALVREGRIRISKSGKYGKPEKEEKEGIFTANAKGFGFVRIPGEEHDVFIPRDKTRGALQGDANRSLSSPKEQWIAREIPLLPKTLPMLSRNVPAKTRESPSWATSNEVVPPRPMTAGCRPCLATPRFKRSLIPQIPMLPRFWACGTTA